MLSPREMNEVNQYFQEIVDQECKQAFENWKTKMMAVADDCGYVPHGLRELTNLFIEEKKHLFWRGYREKVIHQIKNHLSDRKNFYTVLRKKVGAGLSPPDSTVTDFNHVKNRLFLETYLTCGKNQRQAAAKLNIPKSTFHDWLKENMELVIAEERKSEPSRNFQGSQK